MADGLTPLQSEIIEYRKEGVSQKDLQVSIALWTASNAQEYPVRRFPALPAEIRRYAEQRIQGVTDYNAVIANTVGVWINQVTRIVGANAHDLSTFEWALTKLGKNETLEREIRIRRDFVETKDPLAMILKCASLDAIARTKLARSGSRE